MAKKTKPGLKITPELMALVYDFISECDPFSRWNMPHSEDVKFVVTRSRVTRGIYYKEGDKHVIGASINCCGWVYTLCEVIAHEMVHLHQNATGQETPHAEHNAAFMKMAEEVCHSFGFHPHTFV